MSSKASTYLTTYPMFSSPASLPELVSLRSNHHTPSKGPAHKAARIPRTRSIKAKEAFKLNLAKSATLDSQAEAKDRLEENGILDPSAYTNEWVLKVGGGAQPRSEYDYDESKECHNNEVDEGGKVDTTGPGSDEDWAQWMSEDQIRTAYRALYAVKNAPGSESSANPFQAGGLTLIDQLFQANMELRKKNTALNSQLLQASMELQKMKSFMAVAGEKLLKTGGRAMPASKQKI